MPCWILTFFLGVFTLTFCRTLPSLYWLLGLIPMITMWFIVAPKVKRFILHVLVFGLGFSWILVYTHVVTNWSLPLELEGKKVLVTGYVAAPPSNKHYGVSFEFKTKTVAGKKVSAKLKLGWYGKSKIVPKISAGDRWQLLVRLKRPHGVLNPGGFDLEKHLLMHHIRATGYVIDSELNQILESHFYHYPLSRLRQFLISKMAEVLSDEELAPIIIAFASGAQDKITQPQWQVMRDTGTSYLVAIAGLHIGLVASIAFLLAQFLWRLSRRLPLIIPAKEAGIIVGLVFGFIYGAVSGFSIPTERSLVMLVMFSFAVLMRRNTKSWNAWLWSLFLVLIINPLAILTIGFWLSFSAVASIIYVSNGYVKVAQSHLGKFWRMQLTVTVALLPFTLLFFQQFSFITIIANLIAMPGVCLVVVPMSLLGAITLLISSNLGGCILWGSAKLLYLIWWWLTFLSHNFNGSWYHPIYNWWVLITASIGVVLLLAPRGFPTRLLGLVWLLPLFFYVPPKPEVDGQVWFTLLDAGQGLAAVVQTKSHILLYDTGPRFFDNDAGASIIVPYLRQKGIQSVDTMIISHGDSDHSGGATSVLSSLPVSNIVTSVPEKYTSYAATPCINGQHWQWDGVDFYILSPPANTFLDSNNASCVLKIVTRSNSLLLTGDIEREAENLLLENHRSDLKSTILVAPHHGSATSSTEELVAAVAPQYVIFPVGYNNRFHFPHKKVMARYLAKQAKLLDVSRAGAITFKFDDNSGILEPECYRQKVRHIWYD